MTVKIVSWRVIFSLLYFQKFPLSSDVITPALVQEGTSRSGVSFPPPTHPITASPADRLLHSGSLSAFHSHCVCSLRHPLIETAGHQLKCLQLCVCVSYDSQIKSEMAVGVTPVLLYI